MRFSSSRSKRMQTSRESGDRLGELSAVAPQEWVRAVEGASARPKTIVSSTIALSMKLRGLGGKALCDCRMTEGMVQEDHASVFQAVGQILWGSATARAGGAGFALGAIKSP